MKKIMVKKLDQDNFIILYHMKCCSKKTVDYHLIIYNELDNAKLLENILKLQDISTIMTNNLEKAIQIVNSNKHKIIFIWIYMSSLDGIYITKYLRNNFYLKPIIFIISYNAHLQIPVILHSGATRVIHEPIKMEQIKSLLNSY